MSQNAYACRAHCRHTRYPSGFTLVELLVVIAIISILVLLLLPAVNAAREAAQRTQCINNLMQLSVAIHNYEYHFESLPPGSTNPNGPIRNVEEGIHVGWLVKILPYLEENAMYQRFDQTAGVYADVNRSLRTYPIVSTQCPSQPSVGESDDDLAQSSYAGCHHDVEAPIDDDNHGLLFLNSSVTYADIYDGSAKTILLGEVVASDKTLGWASGTRTTLRNGSRLERNPLYNAYAVQQNDLENDAEQPTSNPLFVGGFGSFHAGSVVNFAFADGSIHSISDQISLEVLQRYCHRADGELIRD